MPLLSLSGLSRPVISSVLSSSSISMPLPALLGTQSQARHLQIFPRPPKLENTNLPEKFKLPVMPKVPHIYTTAMTKPPKGTKELYRMMGEDRVQNELVLDQYAVIAASGGALGSAHFEMMRGYVFRNIKEGKSFAFYRVDPPYKAVTNVGVGKKKGGGKGPISHFITPVKAGRVILEVGGTQLWEEVHHWMSRLASKLPFDAVVVNKEMLDRWNEEEKRFLETNENPYTFEWLVRNNMMDCQRYLSPRDQIWFGKHVYRDRTNQRKWKNVRMKPAAKR